jgi:hypothetical protein
MEVSYRWNIIRSCFIIIPSTSFCFLIGVFKPFTLTDVIDIIEIKCNICLCPYSQIYILVLIIIIYQKQFQSFFLLFICAYKAWVMSPPCPHPLPYHPLWPLPLPPTSWIPGKNYFALISNFVEERV